MIRLDQCHLLDTGSLVDIVHTDRAATFVPWLGVPSHTSVLYFPYSVFPFILSSHGHLKQARKHDFHDVDDISAVSVLIKLIWKRQLTVCV